MVSIGIYPGTFDPVHDGHVAFARKALDVYQLDTVVFAPEQYPRQKSPDATLAGRVEHIDKLIKDDARLSVRSFTAPRFTLASTAPELTDLYPSAKLSLLIGSDVALHLPMWSDLNDLFKIFGFIIAIRSSVDRREVETILTLLQKQGHNIRYDIIEAPLPDASSSRLRAKKSTKYKRHP